MNTTWFEKFGKNDKKVQRRLAITISTLLFAGAAAVAQQPLPHAHIYPEVSAASDDLSAALKTAKREHKRVLLDFGGDWCGDCQVLNVYFHQPENRSLLDEHFVLVDVNIGHFDQNVDLTKKYQIDMHNGVPQLAVLDGNGKQVVGQHGEFRQMRDMQSSSVHEFLEKWK